MLTIAASSVLFVVLFAIIVFMFFCVVVPVSYCASKTDDIYHILLHNFCNLINSPKFPVFLLFLPLAVVSLLQ